MSTTAARAGARTARPPRGALRLDLLVHGRSRVPGQRGTVFDLATFASARERQDSTYLLACYAPDATLCVVDPDSPPPGARTVGGHPAIRSWLESLDAHDIEVTDLVDGGARVAFTERWQRGDGTSVVAASTAEVTDGLVTAQHSVLAWGHAPVDALEGWTRVSKDLWTTAD